MNKIVDKIVKKSPLLRKVYKSLITKKRNKKYLSLTKNIQVDDKLILFESFMGRSYSCSPKALYLELLQNKKYKDYKFIWIFKDINNYKYLENDRTSLVTYDTDEYYKTYARAKYWIVNSELPLQIKKKDNQVMLQCWHGTPLKKLRCDITIEGGGSAINSLKEIKEKNAMDAWRYDYFISPSKFASDKFRSAFELNKLHSKDIIIEEGYPRNDYLFNYTSKEIDKIKKELNLPKDKKIILYAPTFRDHDHTVGVGYTYQVGIDFDKLKKEFSKDYIILFRAHYFIANSFDFNKYKDFVIDVSKYDDINQLYVISDILITDYSSVFFDYANLKRPMLFYMYDYEEYKNKLRDFYFNIEELPGPIVKEEKDLIKELKDVNKNFKKYQDKYQKFNQKFNYLDGKNCSEKVLNIFIK